MNYHSDEWIMERLNEHYQESLQYFKEDQIVGIFIQGSQNYGLDYEDSDIDTKLIVCPTLDDLIYNRQPISTTHIRENDEHIDFKDIRLYMQTFRKQNLNFLEILFTKYKIINSKYYEFWKELEDNNEKIARYNVAQGIKSMKGIALEKYFAMEHRYPSRIKWIDKFGYDPKQLHHLLRVEEYIQRYIEGEPYKDCLDPNFPEFLIEVKRGKFNLKQAKEIADEAKAHIEWMCENFLQNKSFEIDEEVEELLNSVQYKLMYSYIKNSL